MPKKDEHSNYFVQPDMVDLKYMNIGLLVALRKKHAAELDWLPSTQENALQWLNVPIEHQELERNGSFDMHHVF